MYHLRSPVSNTIDSYSSTYLHRPALRTTSGASLFESPRKSRAKTSCPSTRSIRAVTAYSEAHIQHIITARVATHDEIILFTRESDATTSMDQHGTFAFSPPHNLRLNPTELHLFIWFPLSPVIIERRIVLEGSELELTVDSILSISTSRNLILRI